MKFNITWKKTRVALEAYVLIKYNVISDALRTLRHVMNAAGETVSGVASEIGEIGVQADRTSKALEFQKEAITANAANVNGSVALWILTTAIALYVIYRLGPLLSAVFFRGTPAKPEKNRTGKKSTCKAPPSGGREARFQKWVARYGGDFKTKKEAKAAFEKFEKDMGYS